MADLFFPLPNNNVNRISASSSFRGFLNNSLVNRPERVVILSIEAVFLAVQTLVLSIVPGHYREDSIDYSV